MNIYEKLNEARIRFQESGAKKSGRNSFAKYDYFELSDILPAINRAARELGFSCMVRFGKEEATLEIVDCEKPEDRIIFCSPMGTADLKGCHPVQSLGAVETYVRRYLYLAAFEITESDGLDATAGQAQAAPAAKPEPRKAGKDAGLEMKRILESSKYPDGSPVFSETDRDYWRGALKEHGAESALRMLKNHLKGRLDERKGGEK